MRLRTLLALGLLGVAFSAASSATTGAAVGAAAVAENAIQIENARPGNAGWEIPVNAGQLITGYASETSVLPGQIFHLHVEAPVGTRYRIVIYRLGWYHGVGGRLIMCLPGCHSSRAAVPQPPPTPPGANSGLFEVPWKVTDLVKIPLSAVTGFYEAKLEIVSGQGAGALGEIPLVVRELHPTAPVLIEIPVNTWQAYNPWGGKSLYGMAGTTHAYKVTIDRPYDGQFYHDVATRLQLPWIRFLERNGIDVAYQTNVDTDRDPGSLLQHRLVFPIGHDEYWSQRMRDGYDRALALGTNMIFGSNAGLWRIRYADDDRTIVEWRDPLADPAHNWRIDTGEFRRFGEPECQLMGVEYEEYAQRPNTEVPTPYTVIGPARDPWLAAAGLKPGDVIPGVVGYEWDQYIPGCFKGTVVPLMDTAPIPGPGGSAAAPPVPAYMVRATAPSGGEVLGMGTMELSWALDSFADGATPNPAVKAFMLSVLRDLERPASPARLIIHRTAAGLAVSAVLRSHDPRIERVAVHALGGAAGCPDALHHRCVLPAPRDAVRYSAVAIDRWGASPPLISGP